MNSVTSKSPSLTIIKPTSGWHIIDFAELKEYRDLFLFLVWRDIKILYAQTILGFAWAILNPLLQIIIFTLVFGKVAKVNTDYGERITRSIITAIEQEDNNFIACQKITLGLSQGFNTTQGSVSIEMSRDNVLYGPPVYIDLGKIGEYEKELSWNPPGGLGTYKGFMGVRFSTTEDIDFSADYIIMEIR